LPGYANRLPYRPWTGSGGISCIKSSRKQKKPQAELKLGTILAVVTIQALVAHILTPYRI
jgi:hypothetical protein